jgi:cytolethal distending toxin subunit B
MKIVNWNMQGANHTLENKWNQGVANLLNHVDVCSLQECGGIPPSAQLLEANVAGIDGLKMYTWGTSRATKYILYFPWDVAGNRCNLAVVSNIRPIDPANDGFLFYPDFLPVHRPVIGMMVNNIAIFSIHAISGGGNDAPGLINKVDTSMAGSNWTVSGDYNRTPGSMVGTGGVICPPNQNTYSVLNPYSQIDYMIKSGGLSINGEVLTSVILSDHYPVLYDV